MADPVVHITAGLPDSGTGNITTLGQTLLDGANITQGAIADAVVAAGATGSISAKLRAISRDLVANIVLAAGTAIIGKVTTDQTTHGTTDLVAADITKVAGASISQGHGTAATAIRVELPTDGTGSVNAVLGAETTKAIGVVRVADGSGNLVTSTSNALDINVKSGGNANGRAVPGSSAPVVQASQTYQDVAASATATILGSTGATGDWLDGILIIPETTSAGTVAVLDLATSVNIFVTGTLTSLVPFYVPMGCLSKNGAWKITTGAAVHIRAFGNFT